MGSVVTTRRLPLAISVVAAALLLTIFGTFADFLVEDTYICFRYASNLVAHGELVFNRGEYVEGYTNFLWVIVLAAAHAVGMSMEVVARFAGVACAVATAVVLYRWCLRTTQAAFVAPVLLASSSVFGLWAFLGLEGPLFALLVTAAYCLVDRATRPTSCFTCSLLFALAYLTRPDGALFAAVGLIGIAWRLRKQESLLRRANWVALAAPPVVFGGGHLVWRLYYYQSLLPNTYYAKVGVSTHSLWSGVGYVTEFLLYSGAALAAVIGLIRVRSRMLAPAQGEEIPATSLNLVVIAIIFYCLYLIWVGGDYMGASRLCVPLVPLLVYVYVQLCRDWLRGPRSLGVIAAMGLILGGLSAAHVRVEFGTTRDAFISRLGFMKVYTEDRLIVGQWLQRTFDEPITATGSAMGIMPWHMLPVRVIDARGLTDRGIARAAKASSSRPGHRVFAPDGYLLRSQPEVAMHKYAIADTWRLAGVMERVRLPGYHPVCVSLPLMYHGDWFCFAKRRNYVLGAIGVPPSEDADLAVVYPAGATDRVDWRPQSQALRVRVREDTRRE